MVTLLELKNQIAANPDVEFCCCANLNLYDSTTLDRLATQAVAGRQLRIMDLPADAGSHSAIHVTLCEDDYPGWIAVEDLDVLDIAETAYRPVLVNEAEIRDRLPNVIHYTHLAMQQPNHYLWGGTVGPNYDCSGLMQAAFLSVGVWIPRDAYQQHAFTSPVSLDDAMPGDLVFFGNDQRITHVGLYLGDRRYIHSSGKEIGRNGIGIDELSAESGPVSHVYLKQFKRLGRLGRSYSGKTH
ncbi:MAG: NlpC/P60 family protein [Leptolyngbyaceae bacterium]|nr:NlpC/P60 family protein [Leptolyngbyaceae bacterium]